LEHIDRQKYQMDFLVHSTEQGAYDDEVRALGSQIIPCLKPSNPLQYALNFREVLRKHGPYDCVHSHMHHYTGYILALAASMRVPMRIAHSHIDTRVIDRKPSLPRMAYLSGMEALIRHYATAGTAVSEVAARSLFSESWRRDYRWNLTPLGIDLSPFKQQVDSQQVRAQLGIPADAFVVGHVGRFCQQKNHLFLVEIAEKFVKREPKAAFLLVGEGPLKSGIEEMVRSRGLDKHFIFAGVREDVPTLMMGAMDCFLFPSLYEGLGLVLWEAQAAGLQCVVSGAVPEEADVIPLLIKRLSLDAPVDQWVDVLQRAKGGDLPRSRHNLTFVSQLQKFAIEISVARVQALYRSIVQVEQMHASK